MVEHGGHTNTVAHHTVASLQSTPRKFVAMVVSRPQFPNIAAKFQFLTQCIRAKGKLKFVLQFAEQISKNRSPMYVDVASAVTFRYPAMVGCSALRKPRAITSTITRTRCRSWEISNANNEWVKTLETTLRTRMPQVWSMATRYILGACSECMSMREHCLRASCGASCEGNRLWSRTETFGEITSLL